MRKKSAHTARHSGFDSRSKFHYFGKDGRSLCGKWAKFTTHIDTDEWDEHPDNCAACKKRVVRYRAAITDLKRALQSEGK